jgi:translation initiation factor IF-3
VVDIAEAQAQAKQASLDLVEVSPNAEPPVCRIMDFGKFRYEQSKHKVQKTRRQQVKEIKFRPGTDVGDYKIKVNRLKKFLETGDKVKITVRFRGREMSFKELGMELIRRVEADLQELGSVESQPKLEGRQMVMMMAPIKREGAKKNAKNENT